MGRMILCTGKRAENPYYFAKTCTNLYAVEELCYLIGENAYLLDDDIADRELARWLGKECGLTDLAQGLDALLGRRGSACEFAVMILKYTGYHTKEEIARIETVLRDNAGVGQIERRKSRADYLVKNNKLIMALHEYDKLVHELQIGDRNLLCKVYNNKGTALARLFLFEQAAREYKNAYDISGRPEHYFSYLAAVRLSMEEQDYVSFVAADQRAYEPSLELEKELGSILQQWQESDKKAYMDVLLGLKEGSDKALYYKEVDQITNQLKQEYLRLCEQ